MFKKILVLAGILALALLLFFLLVVEKQGLSEPQHPWEKWGTLSYVDWTPAGDTINKAGVVTYDRRRAYPGFNLYCSKHSFSALLLDMQGRPVHRWAKKTGRTDFWHHVEMCKNGGLLVMVKDKMLMCLDRQSTVRWICRLRFHHDISLSDSGDIYAIARKDSFVVRHGLPFPLLQDCLVILSPDGKVRREIAVYPLVKAEMGDENFLRIYRWLQEPTSLQECRSRKRKKGYYLRMDTPVDLLHTNTLDVVGCEIPGVCRKGDLLISVRELDLIGIVDIQSEKLVWQWGPGILEKQHHPQVLANGHILVFDNGFNGREYSRVLELDPVSRDIVWEYRAPPPQKFFSQRGGSCQRLPNGNTLITESDRGRVFEVNPDGTIVWEFYNPHLKKRKKKRATIYRMVRIFDRDHLCWLKDPAVERFLR
jgi:hypothetical protein